MGQLIKYCKKNIWQIAIAIVLAVAGTVLSLFGPNKVGDLSNIISEEMFLPTGINMDAFLAVVRTLIIIYCLSVVFSYVQSFIMTTVAMKISKRLRGDICKKINRLPLKYLDSHSKGDILSRVTNDVDTISHSLDNSTVTLITSVAMLTGSAIMMFVTNWIMALSAIVASLIGFSIMGLIMGRSQKYFQKQQKSLGVLNGKIEENYSGHTVVKAFNGEGQEKGEFEKLNKELATNTWKSQFFSGIMEPLMHFVGNFSFVVVCVVGAVLCNSGMISFGVIVSFMIYIRLFTNPLSQLAQVATTLQSAGAASERVFEFLEEKELEDESGKTMALENVKGKVEFKNVVFGYDEGKTIIKDFSATVKPGNKVAIVGPTGAGKTTLVNLLMRFYELEQPRLIINGIATDYKIFDNGKSIKLFIDDENNLYVNSIKTEHLVGNEKLPKNKTLKFNQDFALSIDDEYTEEQVDYNVSVIPGTEIDNLSNCDIGVIYYGDIFIDEVPAKALTRDNIHNLFGMVLQDTWLYEASVKDNIKYSKTEVSDEEVISACKVVGVDHFIRTLPHGYDTILDDSTSISIGQKQLLTIARAMVEDAPMLILDEATSSVDTRTEQLIQSAMDKLTKGRTTFVIAHRLSTIKNANLILVMKDGNIIESGTHKELIKQGGFYKNLYESQFTKQNSEVIE